MRKLLVWLVMTALVAMVGVGLTQDQYGKGGVQHLLWGGEHSQVRTYVGDTLTIDGLTPVNARGRGATGDGTTDDSDSLQVALNVGGAVWLPKGVYDCGLGTLTVPDSSALIVDKHAYFTDLDTLYVSGRVFALSDSIMPDSVVVSGGYVDHVRGIRRDGIMLDEQASTPDTAGLDAFIYAKDDSLWFYNGASIKHLGFEIGSIVYDVKNYGAQGDGTTDDAVSVQAAIDAAEAADGGIVFFPPGTYILGSEVDVTTSGIYENAPLLVGSGRYNTLLKPHPDSSGYNLVRYTGCFGGIRDIGFDGVYVDSNITGLFIGPSDTSQTSTVVNMSYNSFRDLLFYRCTEGIVLRAGPYVGGSVGGLYFNTFDGIEIQWGTRGIYFMDGPNASATGINRNQFYSIRIGLSMNTGIDLQNGGTNCFFGCSFEEIDEGTSPYSPATAIVIPEKSTLNDRYNADNSFFGTMFENNSRDLLIGNRNTAFVGHNMTSSTIDDGGTSTSKYGAPNLMLSQSGYTAPQRIEGQQVGTSLVDSMTTPSNLYYMAALPDTGDGLAAIRGSTCMVFVGSEGYLYVKYGAADTAWAKVDMTK